MTQEFFNTAEPTGKGLFYGGVKKILRFYSHTTQDLFNTAVACYSGVKKNLVFFLCEIHHFSASAMVQVMVVL